MHMPGAHFFLFFKKENKYFEFLVATSIKFHTTEL